MDSASTSSLKAACVEQVIAQSHRDRLALMCAEAVLWRCHRSLIADALLVRGYRSEEERSWIFLRPSGFGERNGFPEASVWATVRAFGVALAAGHRYDVVWPKLKIHRNRRRSRR